MPDPVEIRFDWTDRLMAAGAAQIRGRWRWRILRSLLNFRTAAVLVVLVVIGFAISPPPSGMGYFGRGVAYGALVGAAALFLAADAQSWTLHGAEAAIREARGKAVVRLSTEGVELTQGGERYGFDWPALLRVVDYGGGLMLFTSIFRAVPVPDEGLPEGVTRDEVRARIEAWRREAGA